MQKSKSGRERIRVRSPFGAVHCWTVDEPTAPKQSGVAVANLSYHRSQVRRAS